MSGEHFLAGIHSSSLATRLFLWEYLTGQETLKSCIVWQQDAAVDGREKQNTTFRKWVFVSFHELVEHFFLVEMMKRHNFRNLNRHF